jgi:hypothetical protein
LLPELLLESEELLLEVELEPELELDSLDLVEVLLLSLVEELPLSFADAPPLEELYKSAYQPPPFRMNPAPPDT